MGLSKMKKKLFALTLAAALVLSSTSLPAGAYSDTEKNTADALYCLHSVYNPS